MSAHDETEPGEPGESGEPTTGALSGEVIAARPAIDPAAMQDVRARAERALFGRAEPPRLGRFVLLRPIAGGGMGMIHRAYDPQLERPVALKLLHPRQHATELARARLIAEARVLARLAHPNVVPVYEVLEIEGQVVIVMELVEGRTLAEWERERRRTWREVVAVYAQAGRGLAAAHDLGIVHRDFKPSNAIVGDDGRVRVLDFGLARRAAPPGAPEPVGSELGAVATALPEDEPAPSPPPSLTRTGEVLGTVLYMAPEQLAGEVAIAASDQFSFCVSLHRALHGVPPFAGQDASALRESIAAGRVVSSPGARVPAWLRAAVGRGLAAAPEARHPSMRALLDELGRERGWRRWRWAALAAALVALSLGAAALSLGRPPDDALAICDAVGGEADRAWNADRREELRGALARTATPYARTIGDRLLAALDGYRDRWASMRRAACREYRSVRLSDERFDRRSACLDLRLQDLASAVDVLAELDASSVANAVDVAARLPPVEPCAEQDAAPEEGEEGARPASPELRREVAAIREQLSRAGALERAGRSAEALALAEAALAAARRTALPRAVLEATLARGRILMLRYDFANAIAPLAAAEQLALEHRQLGAAVVAGARRLYAEGIRGMDPDRLAGQVALLEPLSRGLRGDAFARPLLLNYVGVVYMARGDRARAREHFEAARGALDGAPSPDSELWAVDMNLAMVTEDRATREDLARRAWQRVGEQLGPHHLTTLGEQCRYAHYVGDPVRALALAREAGDHYRRFHPDQIRARVVCGAYGASLAADLGAPEAASLYAEAADLARGSAHADVRTRGRLADGSAHLYRTRPEDALGHFAAVIAELGGSDKWWDQQLAAEARLGAGLAEEALGAPGRAAAHLERAGTHLERAESTFAGLIGRNEDLELRLRLALSRASLARVLRRRGAGPADARARELEAQARAFYREANPDAYRARLEGP